LLELVGLRPEHASRYPQEFSGGQRQRIGIARALLRDPELLILDEATNAVDGISEAAIMTLIQRRAGHKLTIVISHRPSTIASCQDGLVLDRGRVVESGPLEGLSFFEQMSKANASPEAS
jgi:ABC-type multidrug transport system fused ATPase/permease subunit